MELLHTYLDPLLPNLVFSVKWFLICLAVFVTLYWFAPGDPKQPFLRRDMKADVLYWFLGPFLYGYIFATLYDFLLSRDSFMSLNRYGTQTLATLPVVVQALIILLITDFLQYWAHRGFHSAKLWRFHSIHHSPVNIDWLTSVRFHPVNIILYSTFVNVLVYTVGFSGEAFAILLPFNMIYSPLVHANLNWNYGPFRYVLASPVFHRWHHTHPDKGGNSNFAPTFPFLDVMFGTFYMPEGELPSGFGTVDDPVPETLLGQIVYPFRRRPVKS